MALDLARITELVESYVRQKPEVKLPTKMEPVECIRGNPGEKHRALPTTGRDTRARLSEPLRFGDGRGTT